ncbi:MAG: hypothetical protein M1829_004952 [Trizodia sp. TS-e1964]|nr:MAG: hypothetical protein M1829_004952 [Trizodia sp. TS-e1964]
MLGRLFSASATSRSQSSTRPSTAPESVQEELHTRTLLFPDASLLHQTRSHSYPLASNSSSSWLNTVAPESFDSRGEVDLEFPRDIRILIAQESTAANAATVLYDTRPAPEAASSPPPHYRNMRSKSDRGAGDTISMDGFLSTTPRASQRQSKPTSQSALEVRGGGRAGADTQASAQDPASKRQTRPQAPHSLAASSGVGAFQRAHQQRRGATAAARMAEPPEERLAREQREEVKTFLGCMFGSASMSYKGTGTKLHIIPSESMPDHSRSAATSPTEGLPPFSQAGSRRSSQSFVPTPLAPIPPASPPLPPTAAKARERETVLVTRVFPVPWVEQERYSRGQRTPTSPHPLSRQRSHQLPRAGSDQTATQNAKDEARRRKTPMYAIGLLIHLPTSRAKSAPGSRSGPHPHSASFFNTAPFSPSTGSEQEPSWSPLDPFFGLRSSMSDADEGMQNMTQHWDVIMRSLSHLQSIARRVIQQCLRDTDSISQVPSTKHGPLYTPTTKSRQQMLELAPGALFGHYLIQREVDKLLARVILGIRIPRVITGQGRWGVWRDEARVVGRMMHSQDQPLYFFKLLTACLATHTEWLNSLGPRAYRQRHQRQRQRRSAATEDLMIQSRTVVVSHDKIAARRLLFLLSAFFPASQPLPYPSRNDRPGTPTALHGYSQPPPVLELLRGESLRRSISRRGSERLPFQSGARSKLSTSFDENSIDSAPGDIYSSSPNLPLDFPSSRRTSDSPSIRTANLPIPTNSSSVQKAVSVTPATLTPATTVPHFSSIHFDHSGTAPEPRPGSSGSLASINLMHTLKRNDSTGYSTSSVDSLPPSRWGSLLSGFWSTSSGSRTDSASENTDPGEDSLDASSTDDNPKVSAVPREKAEPAGKLSRMVAEVDQVQKASRKETEKPAFAQSFARPVPSSPFDMGGAKISPGTSPQKGIPLRASINRLPTRKISVNKKDGVIDVDMKLPTSLSSLLFPPIGLMSNASSTLDPKNVPRQVRGNSFTHLDPELQVNVAGWLKRFHSDFSLQSVAPYDELENEIKQAMSNEPSPPIFFPSPKPEDATTPKMAPRDAIPRQLVLEKWVDVSSTVIADLATFTIKRIRLRRLIRIVRAPEVQKPPLPLLSQLNAEIQLLDELSQTPTQATPMPSMLEKRQQRPKQVEKERPQHPSRAQHSQYGNPPSPPERLEQVLEEEFSEEIITDMDKVLFGAIERIMAVGDSATTAGSPQTHSTGSSRASSRKGSLGNITVAIGDSGEVPKGECKKIVFKALEEVIGCVAAERRLKRHERREKRRAEAASKRKGKGKARDKGKERAAETASSPPRDTEDETRGTATVRLAPLSRSTSFLGLATPWRKAIDQQEAEGKVESTLRKGVRKWFDDAESEC